MYLLLNIYLFIYIFTCMELLYIDTHVPRKCFVETNKIEQEFKD